jgi:ribonucleoside-diphosphate reductase alpha chain
MNDAVQKESNGGRGYERSTGITFPDYVNGSKFENNFSENQKYSFTMKYLLRDNDGKIVETPTQAVYRVARTMAEIEGRDYGKTPSQVDKYTKEFFDIIESGKFSPAGRIWTNAGTDVKGLFNCYVLPVNDTIDLANDGIFTQVAKAAVIHKNGGGTGYNFSELRPRGTYVKTSKGIASGPVSFIGQFDKETEIINSGNRRGANMGILDVYHPDILDFIYAKSRRGEMTNFNVSVGVTDEFMRAVESNASYGLEFPKGTPFNKNSLEKIITNIEDNKLGASGVGEKPRPSSLKLNGKDVIDSYTDSVAGRVTKKGNIELFAPYVLDQIANLAHETADPGMIFLDEINKTNPLPLLGLIKATNPCGEQPLHPYDACNLASIILSNFVKETRNGPEVDYESLEKTVRTGTRFMDNVNDASLGPIDEVKQTTMNHRRIGMGVMGWADMLIKMGIPYDSEDARGLATKVMGTISDTAREASVELAKEKGVFPSFEGSIYDTGNEEDRVRNVDRTTIAPTGTISMVYEVTSGIEPAFAISWKKHIRGGDELIYTLPSFVEECQKRNLDINKISSLIEANHGSVQGIDLVPKDMQDIFKTSHDLHYKDHILMQAAFQSVTDNAVSKTINMPNLATVEDVKDAYFLAWKNNLKGITVYRDGSKDIQVLTTGHNKNSLEEISKENPLKVSAISPSLKLRQKTPFGNIHMHVVVDPGRDYAPIEVFSQLGNAGTEELATTEALGRLTSLYLRTGGNLDQIIAQLSDIGTGNGIATRDGGVHSLPMGFARGLKKFQKATEVYGIENLLLGKVDLDKVEGEISDMLRTGGNGDWDSKRLPEENDGIVELTSKFNEGNNENKKASYANRCPTEGCGANLFHEEGCSKCHSCGYSTC